jgi:alkanesulfonate monooxygenase SsuD/methylene tetrahydromethanopterin reductase-like flavin-dependent oxidoreductase (luciferase family)
MSPEPNSDDYTRLHQAMERAGFSRYLSGRHLPTAEYWLTSNLEASAVRDKAVAIAAAVKPDPEVLVVQVATWACHLTPVRKAG